MRLPYYKAKEEDFWKTPLVLRLRARRKKKTYWLRQLDFYTQTELLKGYCKEIAWRCYRGRTEVTKREFDSLRDRLAKRYLSSFTKQELRYFHISSELEDGDALVAWTLAYTCAGCEEMFTAYEPVGASDAEAYSYHWRDDDYATAEEIEELTEEMSPVEAELISVAGEHSPTPWVPIDNAFTCPLCERVIPRGSYFPKGAKPNGKRELRRMIYAYTANTAFVRISAGLGDIEVCGGPCAKMLEEMFPVTGRPAPKDRQDLFTYVFRGVIRYASSNKNVRRAAEDFVRYARPVFERRDYGAGRQSGGQDFRQHLEIGSDRLGA